MTHEIPDHLKPHIRHARHYSPDGSIVETHGSRQKPPEGSPIKSELFVRAKERALQSELEERNQKR